ncbi:MAG TPA: DUF484 family protein [Gammaproteobacteria bacterium]|nr:DUF484 family protein [Gammaproteobacteria bacterium]
MSQSKSEAGAAADGISEALVAEYLRDHPDFFERHGPLLLRLRLPHETSGVTVSLVERQVALLRQRNSQLERQLRDLIAVAKTNDSLVQKIHQLSVKLMNAVDRAARLEQLETSLREDFAAERAALVLFSGAGYTGPLRSGFVRTIDRDDPLLKPFSAFMRASRPRCGPLRDRQKTLLFERDADEIASAAMVPLGPEASIGFLVIGSRDPAHFHPGKRMDFLARIGELVAVALGCEESRRATA